MATAIADEILDKALRRYLVHRFPYGVVYRVSNQIIEDIPISFADLV